MLVRDADARELIGKKFSDVRNLQQNRYIQSPREITRALLPTKPARMHVSSLGKFQFSEIRKLTIRVNEL